MNNNSRTPTKTSIIMVISYPDIRLKKEMESLKKNGYHVQVIMWERGWPFPHSPDIAVKSLKINAPPGNIKSLFYFPLWWSFLIFELFKSKWDAVHAVNFDTYLFSLVVAKIKNKPIIYDIFDFYGDVLPHFLRKIVVTLDKYLLPYSNALILADDSRIEQIGGKIHSNIHTINNSPMEHLFTYTNMDNTTNQFVIFVGGKIVEQRSLDLLISAVSQMEGVKLIIRGHCGEPIYKQRLLELGENMDNLEINLEGVPYQEIIRGTLGADLTIALYDPRIPNNRYASPNKLFEAMASKIPIIVNENTSMANIVKDENCGMIIPYGDENALKNSISLIKDNPTLKKRLGDNGRMAYEKKYRWSIMETRLVNIYSQLLSWEA
ncbi:MAG: glycosyltransferase family 4 protein [Methanobacterium formicicum]|uniref:glycosyltransferase family 4 protein n=1 Tax=Methanobacterium formicicum TaxID=2162 RepID=UPI003530EAF8